MSHLATMLLSTIIVTICLCTGLYLLASAIRNVFFHPLSSFPGPRVAAATILYRAYYDVILHGGMLKNLQGLHKIYGPVVRIAPNELHFNESDAYFDIYSPNSSFPKESSFYKGFGINHGSFGILDIQEAKIRREMLNPLFSRRAILKLEPIVQEKVDKLVTRLSTYNRTPANMSHAFRCASLDIITSYCFAHSFDALDAPDFDDRIILGLANLANWVPVFRYLPCILETMLALPEWIARRVDPFYNEFRHIRSRGEEQVDGFLKNPDSLVDTPHEIVYHHLIKPKSYKIGHETPSKLALEEEAITLLQGGTETVGNASEIGTFMVLNDKEVLAKLVTELIDAWPDLNSPMPYTTLEKLPYLTAVIKEALRMGPGVVSPLPRVVGPNDAVIAGGVIPRGTIVSMGITFMHRDEDIFPDPNRFDPERWLQSDTKEQERYLVPFSRGQRRCLGSNLAWCELYIIFANIFRKLDMEIHDTRIERFLDYQEILMTVYKPNSSFHAYVRPIS